MHSITTAPYLPRLRAHIDADLQAVNGCIRRWLDSDVALIRQVGEHLIAAGGKRLRPVLLLLVARALGHRGEAAVTLAAIIEFIHTATLLHDDVVDESGLRRGRITANAVYGNSAAVLVGDFLYSRAFQMMVTLGQSRVMDILANTTNQIAEGEVLQLVALQESVLSERQYFDVIERKTAILFAAASELGALIAGADSVRQTALASAGMKLGLAFQIADDVLDYTGDREAIGKNLGDDLSQGKWTLPLILAEQRLDADQSARLRAIMQAKDREQLGTVVDLIRRSDALDQALVIAGEMADIAAAGFAQLPPSAEHQLLIGLCEFAAGRNH